jgi:hypothetical protein
VVEKLHVRDFSERISGHGPWRQLHGVLRIWLPALIAGIMVLVRATTAHADGAAVPSVPAAKAGVETKSSESPWLLVPILSSNPKLGTSVGAMGAYMFYFDPKSQVSLFGASGQYTSTGSIIGMLFAKTSFAADHQRLNVFAASGNIKNDYDDFLGTGKPLKSEDNLQALAVRYQIRVRGDWFVGVQGVNSNYEILGQSELENETLQTLGLTGFSGGGIGLLVNFDSRDSEFSPHKGWQVNMNNIAYREWLAGDNNYDVYRADIRYYWGHGDRNVLALRQSNQWTVDAPNSAYAPITLRGYKFGQYLGKYMSALEAEERLYIAGRWTATLFAGVACLYGGDLTCSDTENVYPNGGVGVQYLIKEKEGMVLNFEIAKGKGDNEGVLLKIGYGY